MISGEKVGLRAVEERDLPFLKSWRNIERFRKNFREYRELNDADQKAWFEMLQQKRSDNFMFVIIRLETNEPIGAIGLLYVNWIARYADFSFYIGDNKEYISKSIESTESISLMIKYGFEVLNLNKIWMELYETDILKLSFFKDYGFSIDGKLRQNAIVDGVYRDSFILSILRSEFEAKFNSKRA